MAYQSKISEILTRLRHAVVRDGNAAGSDVNFGCGSLVRFRLVIDKAGKTVENINFSSNGCGYMLAAAETLARSVSGSKLAELHGLDTDDLSRLAIKAIGDIVPIRAECLSVTTNALRNAFADFRSRQIEEFRGEKALACTCFGVTEESIGEIISNGDVRTLDEVSDATNAGSGCGSCRMLIQEMLDGGQQNMRSPVREKSSANPDRVE